ncbi:MAG: putative glutathione S-transferase [Rhodothermales bacterium]|jgi:putative glutathione S-transferase
MGLLIDGKWEDSWYPTKETGGRFVRSESQFRNTIGADADIEPGRYHLYVSLACPWASRTLIFRKLKGLEELIPVSVVHPHMLEQGWSFERDAAATGDRVNGFDYLHQIYTGAQPGYTGRVTVPVLWDNREKTIVNNESSEIIRIFNSAFDRITGNTDDYYPSELAAEIDHWNDFIYPTINNGVYRAGFATTQEAYEEAFDALFSAMDTLDAHLADKRFLVGGRLTEADWRLFVTLIRFDAVYYSHFKTNLHQLEDYAHLAPYIRDLYQHPGIAGTVNFAHIKAHYYVSQNTINPSRVVPKGPLLDYRRPHDRALLGIPSRSRNSGVS